MFLHLIYTYNKDVLAHHHDYSLKHAHFMANRHLLTDDVNTLLVLLTFICISEVYCYAKFLYFSCHFLGLFCNMVEM